MVHVLYLLVCKQRLRTGMMNCSGAINVSLGYKTYRILVQSGHLDVLK